MATPHEETTASLEQSLAALPENAEVSRELLAAVIANRTDDGHISTEGLVGQLVTAVIALELKILGEHVAD